ncbi:hypothetical protein [Candidatus Nitrosotenuis sp. DW1]|uniref:hypothetical protein n=1 Tax=Candidatus Nitrosotenuis sp. DW1 TaxID=2259672 RepID=UPI0015CED31F|nr:hypothetical protein [Candidatus Nitrosotenuis sp. DW1]QLH08583.1 hypothetical protein DSQ19_03005 [Candidatus Nitrosotenuis sp. DW1]
MSADEFNLGPFGKDERSDPNRKWFRKLAKGNGIPTSEDGDYAETFDKPIIEEQQGVAEIGQLGGKSTSNKNGTIVKKTLFAVCDCCYDPLDGPPAICPLDRKKVHSKCMIRMEQQPMCRDCLRRIRPLSKSSYKIMMLILMLCRLKDRRAIQDFTSMLRDDIILSFTSLLESGYAARRGSSNVFDITEKGVNIMLAYETIYGVEKDVIALESQLREYIGVL